MIAELTLAASAALLGFHHLAYPLILRGFARGRTAQPEPGGGALPAIHIIVPAKDEAAFIRAKIENLAELDYPRALVTAVLALDGCRDGTARIARDTIASRDAGFIEIVETGTSQGKIAVLNREIARCAAPLVLLTDASALLHPQTLRRAAAFFADPRVGVVALGYRLGPDAAEGERLYWRYQSAVKAGEATLGAPIGAHGAGYLIRRSPWTPLPPGSINDDVLLPMQIIAKGYTGVYDDACPALEAEKTGLRQDFRRRMRFGAGNLQQAFRLLPSIDVRRPGLAFAMLGGKILRGFAPFLAALGVAAAVWLAIAGAGAWRAVSLALLTGLGLALGGLLLPEHRRPRWLGAGSYIVLGYTASFLGAVRHIRGGRGRPWDRVAGESGGHPEPDWTASPFIPASVIVGKRVMDITIACVAAVVLAILFVPIALAIKLTSKGPVFYRQMRVGTSTPNATRLFWLIKFRTMYEDAERRTGPVWASKNDPRITPVGGFLRKTRLDELPQCLNVLRGEMSVIGPRPERPGFCVNLEREIPFYTERMYGVRPGITGLAQVKQGYDESLDDVRRKVMFDHTYALRISRFWRWILCDLSIMLRTIVVMMTGRGQ
jgi:lipopolysaccharide/colanic/teichoic acid biosynthesis glycosyltransferase